MRMSDWSSDVCSSDLETASLVGNLDKAGLNTSQMMSGLSRSLVNLAKDGEEPADAFRRVVGEIGGRSEERRVGKACVSTCRSRWSLYNQNNKRKLTPPQHHCITTTTTITRQTQ